jgi:hypothetical protein
MSIHKDCGADIRWFKRDDDESRFMPPMELAGEGYIIDPEDKSGMHLVWRYIYRPHMRDPAAVIEWQRYQEQLSEAKGEEVGVYEAVKTRSQDEQWDVALLVACTKCHMLPGERCVSQQKHLQKTGEIINTNWPHPERLEAGYNFKENLS